MSVTPFWPMAARLASTDLAEGAEQLSDLIGCIYDTVLDSSSWTKKLRGERVRSPDDAEAASALVAVVRRRVLKARAIGDLTEDGVAAVGPAIGAAAADAAP